VITLYTPLAFKARTVGCFCPGIEDCLDPVPGVEGGRLFFRGPNRMMGHYLPEKPGLLAEPGDWYDTANIVSVDSHGFLTILGRVECFAKIAGKIVPSAPISFNRRKGAAPHRIVN
jgi:acyl-[acyl-carrier-protein]-phospholipid O-acyltransferase/long-chain-fatty-acid--[acyl-carrier-protein] ligase